LIGRGQFSNWEKISDRSGNVASYSLQFRCLDWFGQQETQQDG
jgi:hypothetical protein